MGLVKSVNLTVDGYTIKLSSPLRFYQNDQINLIFTLNEIGIEFRENGGTTKTTMPIIPLEAYLFIEAPDGTDVIKSAKVINNKVIFRLKEEHTQHLGTTRLQIVLIDEDACRITLPEFNCEIKENIYGDIKVDELLLVNTETEILITDDGDMIITGIDFE